jgi:hypothetical protein
MAQGHLQNEAYTKGIPVDNLLFALVLLAMRWLEPRHNAQLQFPRSKYGFSAPGWTRSASCPLRRNVRNC